ncbi:hypothetical protein ETB97_008848 [Aspergillus alliaceus]|uniref:GPI anchored protein n=1 Tax=Petromyces alliaceus TaxID=209559 RepID=A0A8H5ZRS3_PETAA|nr:hypothetical protein ETB97_008848 [Aspergillus burnettii]
MNILSVYDLIVLFIIFNVAEGAHLALNQRYQAIEFPEARQLYAASPSLDLKARADPGTYALNSEASFHFIHETLEDDAEYVFTTTLNVASQYPLFAVEALDTDIDSISCSDSQIRLSIRTLSRSKVLKQELEAVSDFVIVTSHRGCDLEGERSVHRVTKTTVDLERQIFTFNKVKYDWHDAFHSTRVSFSHRHRSGIQKRTYTPHKKRQQEHSDAPTSTKVIDDGAAPSIYFPTAPTATSELPSTATKSLDKHYIDQKIFPPDIPAADMFIPQGVIVTCKNCSLQGNIEITRGSFNLSGNSIKDTVAFFDDGALEIISNGLSAHVELGLDLSLSQSLASLNVSLPTIPLTPFEIPGVVAFGPIIRPDLTFSVDLVEEIGFSYGFNLSVPDNSKIKINMGDPRNSSITGFGETKIHALPFQSTSALASLIFSVTFTPQILLGISTVEGIVSGGIGAFVHLPKVSVNATQLHQVNEKCEAVISKNESEESSRSALDNVFDNLMHIAPSVDVNMGVLANMQVDVAQISESVAVQTVLASTSYPLPTVCLNFDPKGHRYGAPSRSKSSASATKGADADQQSGTARLVEGPNMVLLSIFTVSLLPWILWTN